MIISGLTCMAATLASVKTDDGKLPLLLRRAIHASFPNATIQEIDVERRIIHFYEVELLADKQVRDISIAPDGTILSMEDEIDLDGNCSRPHT